jgi:hypothetical protein
MGAPDGIKIIACAYIMLWDTAQITCIDAGFIEFDW